MDINKRQENEKKFPNCEELPYGSRMYWYEIEGRMGWKARYLKKVDHEEATLSFWQEIYDEPSMFYKHKYLNNIILNMRAASYL